MTCSPRSAAGTGPAERPDRGTNGFDSLRSGKQAKEPPAMRPRSGSRSCCPWLIGASLFLGVGCEQTRHGAGPKASAPAPAPAPATDPTAPQEVSHGYIVGAKTQDIRKLTPEEEAKTRA